MKITLYAHPLHLGASVKYSFELLQVLHVLTSLIRKWLASKRPADPSHVYPR